jgi:uncharacterized protein YggE
MKTRPAALLLALASPLAAQFAPAPPPPDRLPPPTVTVQGRGEVRVPNTVAAIQLGFEAAGPEEAAVREDVTRRSQAVTAALKDLQVQRLQTAAVSIRPQFAHPAPEGGKRPAPPKITGYLARVETGFSAPVDRAGKIISDMMNLGANSVLHMSAEPQDEARRAAENEALALAAKDAETQARALLGALGLQWAGIRSIDAAGGPFEPGPMPRMMAMAAEAAPLPELDIQGGERVIARQVQMQVEFRQP